MVQETVVGPSVVGFFVIEIILPQLTNELWGIGIRIAALDKAGIKYEIEDCQDCVGCKVITILSILVHLVYMILSCYVPQRKTGRAFTEIRR
jgi:hypothetical protein